MPLVIAEGDRVRPPSPAADAFNTSTVSKPWSDRVALAVVLVCFCAPLFVGLGGWDLANDEAIYSFSALRIVETGDWLTPRALPHDGAFLEKPPLKFWLVAAPIALGLLPVDEFGLRFIDALLGALAFVYVFLLGRWHSGRVSGLVAVLVLYTFHPLVFEHGLRSNNMEAALLLSYVGGVYHFLRWIDRHGAGRAAAHRWPTALYFTLGVLTKFAAIVFLPLVCLAAAVMRRDVWPIRWAIGRAWLGPSGLILLLSAPWFAYQTLVSGWHVWNVMVGQHLYTRFTGALDASHLQPWHYYVSALWQHLQSTGVHWTALAGVGALAVAARRRDGWLARVFLVWGIVPIGLISLGSSKLFHYIYPFLPPIALGVGYVASLIVAATSSVFAAHVAPRIRRLLPRARESRRVLVRSGGYLLIGVAALAALIGLLTAMRGGVSWALGDVELVRNTSLTRPFLLAAVLLCIAGEVQWAARCVAAILLVLALPVASYPRTLERARSIDRPLRAASDCMLDLRRSGARVGETVYGTAALIPHSYNFYLRRFEPWLRANEPEPSELRHRLLEPGHQTPVIVTQDDYIRVAGGGFGMSAPLIGFSADPGLVVLLPGPYAECALPAARAGAAALGFHALPEILP